MCRDYSLKAAEHIWGVIEMPMVEPDQKVSSFSLIKDDEASESCEIHAVHSQPRYLQYRAQLHSMKYA